MSDILSIRATSTAIVSTLIAITLLWKDVTGQGTGYHCDRDFLDAVISDRLEKIPHMLDKAKEVAAEELDFHANSYQSRGVAILAGVLHDIGGDWLKYNRTLGNLFGDSEDRFFSLLLYANHAAFNAADGMHLILGVQRTGHDHDKCSAFPETFTAMANQYNLEKPEAMTASDLLAFTKLIKTELRCLLEHEKEFEEVANLHFALSELIKAIQMRFYNCRTKQN